MIRRRITEENVTKFMIESLGITDPMEKEFVANGVKEFGYKRLGSAFHDLRYGEYDRGRTVMEEWSEFMENKETVEMNVQMTAI